MSGALSERQSRRVQETKLRIVNAMREYLATSTSPDITVEELCERADVARKTFYNHYAGINQLQIELVGEFVLSDTHCRKEASERASDFLGRFVHYVALVIEKEPYHIDVYHRNILRIGIESYFQQTQESSEMMRAIQQAFLVDWLQEKMKDEQWIMPFESTTFFEFFTGIETCATVHSSYNTSHDFRNDFFDAQDLMLRYFSRKKQESQL